MPFCTQSVEAVGKAREQAARGAWGGHGVGKDKGLEIVAFLSPGS